MKLFNCLLTEALFKGQTLGIPRNQMPQIKQTDMKEFMKFLADKGVSVKKLTIEVGKLRPSQKEYSQDKVKSMVSTMPINKIVDNVFLVSTDRYIADGHHRYLAASMINPRTLVNCWQINLSIVELLRVIHDFPKSFIKELSEGDCGGDTPNTSANVNPDADKPNASGKRKTDILGEGGTTFETIFPNIFNGIWKK